MGTLGNATIDEIWFRYPTVEPEPNHPVPSPPPNPAYQVGRAFLGGQKVTQQVNIDIVKTTFNIHGMHGTFGTLIVPQKFKHNRHSVMHTAFASRSELSLAQNHMFGNPHQDVPFHNLRNSRQLVNHTPALHNVITGFVCLQYKYNLSRVPVRNVVHQTIVDKLLQTIRFGLPPVSYEGVPNVIKTRTSISRAPLNSRFQLTGRIHLNRGWLPWSFITRVQLGSNKVANIEVATNKLTFSI